MVTSELVLSWMVNANLSLLYSRVSVSTVLSAWSSSLLFFSRTFSSTNFSDTIHFQALFFTNFVLGFRRDLPKVAAVALPVTDPGVAPITRLGLMFTGVGGGVLSQNWHRQRQSYLFRSLLSMTLPLGMTTHRLQRLWRDNIYILVDGSVRWDFMIGPRKKGTFPQQLDHVETAGEQKS